MDEQQVVFDEGEEENVIEKARRTELTEDPAAAAVSKLARQLASHTGMEEEETTRYLFQRLSQMRGNAALILNRTPLHVEAGTSEDRCTLHTGRGSSQPFVELSLQAILVLAVLC